MNNSPMKKWVTRILSIVAAFFLWQFLQDRAKSREEIQEGHRT